MERILGIVGGTGPESTADYYRSLITSWRERGPADTFPRVIINSVEGGSIIRLLGAGDYRGVGAALSIAVRQLASAGAGAALLASNASHLAFDEIAPTSPIPLIHIVDAAVAEARAHGHRRLALFGTRFVMQSDLYPPRFDAAGIDVVTPGPKEQEEIHEAYLGELVQGIVRDSTRDRLIEIASAMRDTEGIDGVILGGTELALILSEPSYAGIPILNTARIHVEAGVGWLLAEGETARGNAGR